jgi:hypothetical protein
MAASLPPSETAAIRALALAGNTEAAKAQLAALITRLFNLPVINLAINADQYSLNSLNGFFESGEQKFFFKFHQEEGEEQMSGEYYRAGLLAAAGMPVDMPVYVSALPGEQILIYKRRADPRFADILRALDITDNAATRAKAVAAEAALNDALLKIYRQTLHEITPAQAAAEPIHRLFHERLTSRYPNFYPGHGINLPGLTLPWEDFSTRRFVINGVRYKQTIAQLFAAANTQLQPTSLATAGGVTAHGDAHNANVWYTKTGLEFFDPAFAGEHVPSLLAEVKSTFHNIFAHPLWLYDPEEATANFHATITPRGEDLHIETNWALTAIRRDLLRVKSENFWRPWLRTLQDRALLPADWRQTIRVALFLCPTLVMNLTAGRHTPATTAIGFAVAVMAGSEPETPDAISEFLDSIEPRF